MRHARKLAVTAMALATGGCVIGSGTLYHTDNPYQFFTYAAAHGGVPAMVVGDPYPGRRAQVESAAVAALERNFPSLGKAFWATPAARGDGTTKVVLMFNPPGIPLAAAVCADPTAVQSGPGGPRMTVDVVYCGVGPYSESWQSFDTPADPETPLFRDRLMQVVYDAVPRRRNPDRDNGDNAPPR